ncbi:transglycosylase SLT domain-containing protein [Thermodesulfobacteriota bacterium]
MVRTLFFFFCILSVGGNAALAEPLKTPETHRFPSLISSLRIDGPIDFCGETVPLDNPEVRERLEKEMLLMLWDRAQVILWLKRSTRYLPHIEKMLKENSMPDDLKYVPIVESALLPHAGSRKGAIGFWQFMKGTGRKYGLTINARMDERRNFFTSTGAAIRYFKELYAMFGSWTLSAAAYNMGEKGLESEILTQKNNKYYQLYLSLETQRYVLRIVAVKLIMANPQKYGFHLKNVDLYPPLQFDRVKMECPAETPIQIVAEAANTYYKSIKDLNPEIRGHTLARGRHSILIPQGSAKGFHTRYEKLLSQWLVENKGNVYVVKKGDNLTAISRRFDVPLPALAKWNGLNLKKPIHPGQRLIIYPKKVKPVQKTQK